MLPRERRKIPETRIGKPFVKKQCWKMWGGHRQTTLVWHESRNIDRFLANEKQRGLYSQPYEQELTKLHTSDHRMVCTTRLNLTAWGTHSPTEQEGQTEKAEEERLRLPLTTEETATLRQQLDSAYTPEMEEKIREAIHSIIEAPTLKAKRKKIDQAGATVANTLSITRDAAMRSSNLPKKGPPHMRMHGLHLPKVLRKTRDKHLQERNRCRENIASWRRDIREREGKGDTESTEEFLNRTEEMREWER